MAEANSQGRPKQTRKLKPRSAVWKHFTLSVEGIAQCKHCPSGLNGTHGTKSLWKHLVKNHFTTRRTDEQGNEESIVRCKICQREFEAGDDTMENHVKGCIEQDAAAAGTSRPQPPVQNHAASGSGASFMDREPAGQVENEASRDLARMIALGGYDPSIVENDYFKSFVRRLNPRFEVPSRRAIEEMRNSVLDEAKDDFLYRPTNTVAKSTIKVYKYGSASRCIDIDEFSGYEELKLAVARMFGIEGQLEDGQKIGWKLVYKDLDDDMMQFGDEPWEEFVDCVRCIRILSPQAVQMMSLDCNL